MELYPKPLESSRSQRNKESSESNGQRDSILANQVQCQILKDGFISSKESKARRKPLDTELPLRVSRTLIWQPLSLLSRLVQVLPMSKQLFLVVVVRKVARRISN